MRFRIRFSLILKDWSSERFVVFKIGRLYIGEVIFGFWCVGKLGRSFWRETYKFFDLKVGICE